MTEITSTNEHVGKLAKLIRYYILLSTTHAQSGHATSSLSAVELAATVFFKHFRFDLKNPGALTNDRLIFSKGHATPLLYALYAAAGKISEEEIIQYRKFESNLEGHPTMRFPYTEAPTGSLGQGISVGVGEALALRSLGELGKRKGVSSSQYIEFNGKTSPFVYVFLGDGEMAEGSVWEAIQTASFYKLNNLIGIIDVNRLGQSQETMYGYDIDSFEKKVGAFGWQTILVKDGHDISQVDQAIINAKASKDKPVMVIAKTIKGKGVSFLEDKNGWHGKALSQDELKIALKELGEVDKDISGVVVSPELNQELGIMNQGGVNFSHNSKLVIPYTLFKMGENVATRKAYGSGLVRLGKTYSDLVVLDADVKNSTYSQIFQKEFPDRFFEMFIAEQNMVSVAVGMARLGFTPYISTFACFLIRAADQIRMAALSKQHIVFNGSHAGVSIGEDGPSQMGLEDVSLFRTVLDSVVLYPSDAVSTEKLLAQAYLTPGLVYFRTTRPETPVIYQENEEFVIGGSKIFSEKRKAKSEKKIVTVVAVGITVHEALAAQFQLNQEGVAIRVIDCYCIKPINKKTLESSAFESKAIITVEDHYPQGGLGDAVLEALAVKPHVPVFKLAVNKVPRSGKPEELLAYEQIDAKAIVKLVREILR